MRIRLHRISLPGILAYAIAGAGSAQATIVLASADANGNQATYAASARCKSGGVSDSGRFVAFQTNATNLASAPGTFEHVYVKDMQTGAIVLASSDANGTPGNSDSGQSFLASDGSFVVFASLATNLVAGDNNGTTDIFRKDLSTGAVELVSVSSAGVQSNGQSGDPGISRNGRFVGFTTHGTNLFPGDSNNLEDAVVRDLQTGQTFLVGKTSAGQQVASSHGTWFRGVTSDGRHSVFMSHAPNITPGDTNQDGDVFVYDRLLNTTVCASANAQGLVGSGAHANTRSYQCISDDGQFVVFDSFRSTLVPGDTNNKVDFFVKNVTTGAITRANVSSSGAQASNPPSPLPGTTFWACMSSDGRFITFTDDAPNLVPNDTNGAVDLFVRDTLTPTTQSITGGFATGIGTYQAVSVRTSSNAQFIAFSSVTTNFVTPATSGRQCFLTLTQPHANAWYLYGGCGGPGGDPNIQSTSPALGNVVTVSGGGLSPNTLGFLLVGFQALPPIVLGGGCEAHINPTFLLNLGAVPVDSQGNWSFSSTVTAQPAFSGLQMVLQGLFFTGSGLGLDLSDAVLWTLGS